MQEQQKSTTSTGTAPAERRTRPRQGDDGSSRGAGEAAREAVDEAGREVRQTAESVREEAERRGREMKSQAKEQAQRWSSRAGEEVETLARALRTAGDTLQDEGQEQMAQWSRRAAREVEHMGGYLKDEDAGSMLRDLEDLARRNPGTFLGTTFAAGLAAGRFLRSSERSTDGEAARAHPATTPASPAPTGETPGAVAPPPMPETAGPTRTGSPAEARAAEGASPALRSNDEEER